MQSFARAQNQIPSNAVKSPRKEISEKTNETKTIEAFHPSDKSRICRFRLAGEIFRKYDCWLPRGGHYARRTRDCCDSSFANLCPLERGEKRIAKWRGKGGSWNEEGEMTKVAPAWPLKALKETDS